MTTNHTDKDHIIGIDPDIELNGVATLHPKTRLLETHKLGFAELIGYLQNVKQTCLAENKTFVIVVEAGWLNQSNWHTNAGQTHRVAAKIGGYTGANAQVGKLIIEMCEFFRIEVVPRRPLRKCWQGKDGKITHKELASFTGIKSRTNQEERDAALLAWDHAGLPIVIKIKR